MEDWLFLGLFGELIFILRHSFVGCERNRGKRKTGQRAIKYVCREITIFSLKQLVVGICRTFVFWEYATRPGVER